MNVYIHVPDSLADCECRVRDLLCGLPNYQITLDRFMSEYEKMYGSKMSYYGHLKLSNLLESFPSTLNVRRPMENDSVCVLFIYVQVEHGACTQMTL